MHRRRRLAWVPLMWVFCGLTCCHSGPFYGGATNPISETGAKIPEDSGKTSDESEGIPGYLVDPELIAASSEAGKMTIVGSEGAVSVSDRFAETKALVTAAVVTAEQLGEQVLGDLDTVVAKVESDGSFFVELPQSSGEFVVITTLPDLKTSEQWEKETAQGWTTFVSWNDPYEFYPASDLLQQIRQVSQLTVEEDFDPVNPVDETEESDLCRELRGELYELATDLRTTARECNATSECVAVALKSVTPCLHHIYISETSARAAGLTTMLELMDTIASECQLKVGDICPVEILRRPNPNSARCVLGRCIGEWL